MLPESLFITIVSRGRSEAVLKQLQAFGLGGGVVMLGEGTVFNRWLEILGLNESQKDVIFLPLPKSLEGDLHDLMLKNFKLNRRHRGISFSLPLSQFQYMDYSKKGKRIDPSSYDYHCIIAILEEGKARQCVSHARGAGSSGGTIIRGHGAGVPQDSFFQLFVEPGKDLVFFIVSTAIKDAVEEEIASKMNLYDEDQGVIFSLPVSLATGLYQERSKKE